MHLSYLLKSTQGLSTRTASRSRGRGSPPDANFYTSLDETSSRSATAIVSAETGQRRTMTASTYRIARLSVSSVSLPLPSIFPLACPEVQFQNALPGLQQMIPHCLLTPSRIPLL